MEYYIVGFTIHHLHNTYQMDINLRTIYIHTPRAFESSEKCSLKLWPHVQAPFESLCRQKGIVKLILLCCLGLNSWMLLFYSLQWHMS